MCVWKNYFLTPNNQSLKSSKQKLSCEKKPNKQKNHIMKAMRIINSMTLKHTIFCLVILANLKIKNDFHCYKIRFLYNCKYFTAN